MLDVGRLQLALQHDRVPVRWTQALYGVVKGDAVEAETLTGQGTQAGMCMIGDKTCWTRNDRTNEEKTVSRVWWVRWVEDGSSKCRTS